MQTSRTTAKFIADNHVKLGKWCETVMGEIEVAVRKHARQGFYKCQCIYQLECLGADPDALINMALHKLKSLGFAASVDRPDLGTVVFNISWE